MCVNEATESMGFRLLFGENTRHLNVKEEDYVGGKEGFLHSMDRHLFRVDDGFKDWVTSG